MNNDTMLLMSSIFFLGAVFGGWFVFMLLKDRLRARQRFINSDPFRHWKGDNSDPVDVEPFVEKRGEHGPDEHEDIYHDLPNWLKRQAE